MHEELAIQHIYIQEMVSHKQENIVLSAILTDEPPINLMILSAREMYNG